MALKKVTPIRYTWVGPSRCKHYEGCSCDLLAVFAKEYSTQEIFICRMELGKIKTTESMIEELKRKMYQQFQMIDGSLLERRIALSDSDLLKLEIAATGTTNIRWQFVEDSRCLVESSAPIRSLDPRVTSAIMQADMEQFALLGLQRSKLWFKKYVWRPYPRYCPELHQFIQKCEAGEIPLSALAARKMSGFNTAVGMTNGRPHVISAMENMSGEKSRRVMLDHARETDKMSPQLKAALKYVPEALDMMYDTMGVADKKGKARPEIDVPILNDMYLGSAGGSYHETEHKHILQEDENCKVELVVKMGQKKIHSHYAAVGVVEKRITENKPLPPSISTSNIKNEHQHSFGEKQKDSATFAKWKDKARTYEIVDEITVIMEQLTQTARSILEKTDFGPIAIGIKHGRGGIHRFAKYLKMQWAEEWKRVIGDGDINKLDQSIHYIFLQLFYTMGGIYFDKNDPDYDTMMNLIHELAQRMSVRLVRFYQKLWAIVIGKMPSGAWMTSHGDSWIMSLWYFLFVIMEIHAMPASERSAAYEMAIKKLFNFKVYGDDSALSTQRGSLSLRFNYESFATWLLTFLKVSARDVRKDVEFCTAVSSAGRRLNDSFVYLKLYMKRNRDRLSVPVDYLPFRAIDEYQMRVVWGREAKDRDVYDFLLSIMGHSYGTCGTNYRAWLWLRSAFSSAIHGMDRTATLATVVDRAYKNSDVAKKLRMAGVKIEDLYDGFPSFTSLFLKNKLDEQYHSLTNFSYC